MFENLIPRCEDGAATSEVSMAATARAKFVGATIGNAFVHGARSDFGKLFDRKVAEENDDLRTRAKLPKRDLCSVFLAGASRNASSFSNPFCLAWGVKTQF
jgi:hypothetical protein